MRLNRSWGTGLASLAVVTALVAGCAPRASTPVQPSAPLSVGKTTIRAAELPETEAAPRVSKPQWAEPGPLVDEAGPKDGAPRHRDDHRPGGGFSGYK